MVVGVYVWVWTDTLIHFTVVVCVCVFVLGRIVGVFAWVSECGWVFL